MSTFVILMILQTIVNVLGMISCYDHIFKVSLRNTYWNTYWWSDTMSRTCFKILWKNKQIGRWWRKKVDHELIAVEPAGWTHDSSVY